MVDGGKRHIPVLLYQPRRNYLKKYNFNPKYRHIDIVAGDIVHPVMISIVIVTIEVVTNEIGAPGGNFGMLLYFRPR